MEEGEGKTKGFVLWRSKHYRCYRRILCGLYVHNNQILRFLTLTSVPGQKVEIGSAFHVLYKRIRRLTVRSLVNSGYLSKRQASFFYGAEKKGFWDKCFCFDFIRVRTDEGVSGVFHLLYFGEFIPQKWLFDSWKDILGVDHMVKHSVDIRQCKSSIYDSKRLARYCVSQYVAGQDKYVKFYSSAWWVFPYFTRKYNSDRAWYSRGHYWYPKVYPKPKGFSFFYHCYLPNLIWFRLFEKWYHPYPQYTLDNRLAFVPGLYLEGNDRVASDKALKRWLKYREWQRVYQEKRADELIQQDSHMVKAVEDARLFWENYLMGQECFNGYE